MAKPIEIFLSYSPQDHDFAEKLRATLVSGSRMVNVYFQQSQIKAGDSFRDFVIRDKIITSHIFLVILSHASIRLDSVHAAVELALSSGKCEVVPLIISTLAKSDIPLSLSRMQRLDLSTPELYASGVTTLSNLIRSVSQA
jgi:hypothetical protein